jgi:hypothetical protein
MYDYRVVPLSISGPFTLLFTSWNTPNLVLYHQPRRRTHIMKARACHGGLSVSHMLN